MDLRIPFRFGKRRGERLGGAEETNKKKKGMFPRFGGGKGANEKACLKKRRAVRGPREGE